MNKFAVLFVLAGAVMSSVSGHAIPQNCSASYQSALREALDIKEECGDAAPYDCCQILNTVQMMNTAEDLYKIKSGVNLISQVCSGNDYPFMAHDIHGEMKARCDMETDEGGWLVMAGESDNYRLTTEQGEGTISFAFMPYHNNRPFSTRDRDNDAASISCAGGAGSNHGNGGGWWFGSCAYIVFTRMPKAMLYNGAAWVEYDAIEIKIRPKSCIRQKANDCN